MALSCSYCGDKKATYPESNAIKVLQVVWAVAAADADNDEIDDAAAAADDDDDDNCDGDGGGSCCDNFSAWHRRRCSHARGNFCSVDETVQSKS